MVFRITFYVTRRQCLKFSMSTFKLVGTDEAKKLVFTAKTRTSYIWGSGGIQCRECLIIQANPEWPFAAFSVRNSCKETRKTFV
jgi:hypothetical protein